MNSWIEVSEERLAENYRVLTQAAGEKTQVLAVVKANAYGHGVETCAVALAKAGAKCFGVANTEEGARVRTALEAAGLDAMLILVMCGILPGDVPKLVQFRLTPVVWTPEQVNWLADSGVRPHVEIETGMGRQGVRPGAELEDVLDALAKAELVLDGVMTHYCAAEIAHGKLTLEQQEKLSGALRQVSPRIQRLRPGLRRMRWLHAGSSSTLDNPVGYPSFLAANAKMLGTTPMVRCGIALYGYCLPITGGGESQVGPQLKPVMTWKTRVIDVHDVAVGESIGYNAMFTASAAMRVALLPVGYSDGLRRELSSTSERPGGWVMIAGRDGKYMRAPILGRISMNLTTVDVTGIDGVRVGDEVVLLGDGITADDHARLAGTISYEILCGVRAG